MNALPKVLKEHPNTHLLCIGRFEQEYKSILDMRIKELSLEKQITFTGNQNDVVPFIDACDFMLMPSEVESLGIAALEIMARKKTIIATDTGGLPEIIHHQKTGLLIQRTSDAFADAMSKLLNEPQLAVQFGQKAFEFVEQNCTNEIMTQKIEKVYQESMFLK